MTTRIEIVHRILEAQIRLTGTGQRAGATDSDLRSAANRIGFAIPDELSVFWTLQNGVLGPNNIAGVGEMVALQQHLKGRNPRAASLCPLQQIPYTDTIFAYDISTGTMVEVNGGEPPRPFHLPLWGFLATCSGLVDQSEEEHTPMGAPALRAHTAWEVVAAWAQLLPGVNVQLGPPADAGDLTVWDRRMPQVVRETYCLHSSLRISPEPSTLLGAPEDFLSGRRNYETLPASLLRRARKVGRKEESAPWWSDDWLTVRPDAADPYCVDCCSRYGRVLRIFHDEEGVPIVANDLAEFLAFIPWASLVELRE